MISQTALKVKVTLMLLTFFALMFAAIFIPAQTLNYWNGWTFYIIFSVMTMVITYYFIRVDPGLIERRTRAESEKIQKIVQSLNGLFFILLLVIPGLDHNNYWSKVPIWLEVTGDGLVLLGFLIIFAVFKQNSYLANNITAYKDQIVVTTGLYAWVRHPMYSGAYLIILFTPLALGSFYGLFPALGISSLIIVRTLNEEKVLARNLKGYQSYLDKIHYRFIPYII